MNKKSRGILELLFGIAAVTWLMSRCHETGPVFKDKQTKDTVTVVVHDTIVIDDFER
jgi:hypothetical protein